MTAAEWYAYVTSRLSQTEEKWAAAAELGLAELRTVGRKRWDGKQAKDVVVTEQRWVLTDAGLDLFIEGRKSSSANVGA